MTSTKSYITLKEKYDRVIVLIDMDCFYCQVEELLDPENLFGKPIAVVQYLENAGIIAVNYVARKLGVTRHMREKEAKAACPDLVCVKVPSKFNKADISKYREAGKRVANVFEKYTTKLERASIDEAYLDITENVAERVQQMRDKNFTLTAQHLENTFIVGYENIGTFIHEVSLTVDKNDLMEEDYESKSFESSKLRLLIGASIVSDIRRAVKEETGYTCSAGLAHNKILAKLVCGMNKPNKQTVLPIESTQRLFETLEISKIKSMGGKIGEEVCRKLNVKCMAELLPFQESELQTQFGPRIGSFLYLMARGIDLETVERKVMSKSIAVSKNFRGKNEIANVNTLKYWLKELSKELKERIDKDHEETNRVSKQMIVQFTQIINKKDVASSRTIPLNGKFVNQFTSDEIGEEAFKTIERNTAQLLKAEGTIVLNSNIKHLGISAGKLEDVSGGQSNSKSVQELFKNHIKASPKTTKTENSMEVDSSESSEIIASKSKVVTSKSENFLSKFEYKPAKSEDISSDIKASKSDSSIQSFKENLDTNVLNNEVPPKLRVKPINELKSLSKADESSNVLKASIKFTNENSIKGERTLKHWMTQLFTELDKKVQKKILDEPTKIKMSWKQQQNNEIKNFSEQIPINIFTNGINVEFFMNLIKDSAIKLTTNYCFDPISFIELEAFDFSRNNDVNWILMDQKNLNHSNELIEEDVSSEDESTTVTKDEIKEENAEIFQEYSPTDDFYDEDMQPDKLLDMQMKIGNDEDEILKLEQSFLDTSPVKSKENLLDILSTSTAQNFKEEDQPGPSYKSSYVELQKPSNVSSMFDVLNPLEECLECGKMIRKLDMITHIDGHIAMKISAAQREEFRAEQRKKLLQKVTEKSARKTQKSKTTSVIKNSIEKFTKKDSSNDSCWDNSILCEKCNQLIELDGFQMHQDYHYAQQLRMEQMMISKNTNSGIKRKRPNGSTNSNKKDVRNVKSLKEYFKE